MERFRFFIMFIVYLHRWVRIICAVVDTSVCPLRAVDQMRFSRIRLLPYSFIALTRSCFAEIFFIAIPPKIYLRICAAVLFSIL